VAAGAAGSTSACLDPLASVPPWPVPSTVAEVDTTVLTLRTGGVQRVADLTGRCREWLAQVGAEDGLLHVFVPHATAGVAIIETGAGSDDDLLAALDTLLPPGGPNGRGWRHAHGSPGHGRDHVLPAFVRPDATVPVVGGHLALGTWQSVVLVDTNVDNPQRQVRLSFLAG
jgi:secondary thiamine-phosphate synthase enzyme